MRRSKNTPPFNVHISCSRIFCFNYCSPVTGPLWLPETEDLEDKSILSIVLESKSQPLINVNNPGNTEATTETLAEAVPPVKIQPNNRPPRRPKKFVKYEVIGENNVAVPTHLFKV